MRASGRILVNALLTKATLVTEIEAAIPANGLSASLSRKDRLVQMIIQNNSSRTLDLVEADLLAPQTLGANFMNESQPVLVRRTAIRDGLRYLGNCLTQHPSTIPYLGINPLRPILAPNDICVPDHLSLALPATLTPEQEMLPLCFSVYSRQQTSGPSTILLRDIPVHTES